MAKSAPVPFTALTQDLFDWRDRPVASKTGIQYGETTSDGIHRPLTYTLYDNLNQSTSQYRYDGDGISLGDFASTVATDATPTADATKLRALLLDSYDDHGRIYRSQVFSVDQTNGTVGDSLTTDSFYDHAGNIIATFDPSGQATKYLFDGANRLIGQYVTDGGAVNNSDVPLKDWTDAGSVSKDVVLSETESTRDGDGNVILTLTRDRFDNDSTASTGALGSPNSGIGARVYYLADYYDAAGRKITEANVGTNGGTAWTRPSSSTDPSIARSSTVLRTDYAYDPAGKQYLIADPRSILTQYAFDMLGRKTQEIDASSGGSPATGMSITNFAYDGDNHVTSMTAYQPDGAGSNSQTTDYIYGVGATIGKDLFSNDLLAKVEYPDPSTGSASASASNDASYEYNLQGQPLDTTDRNGTIHAYGHDVLGRLTLDLVTHFGAGVDGTIVALGYSYTPLGQLYQATSYSQYNAFQQVETVANQVQDSYNGLGQLISEYQSPTGMVNINNTPQVQYAYSSAALGSRLTEVIYPSGYTLHVGYNSGLDSDIGRLSFVADDDGSGGIGQHIEEYSYLGLSTIVADNRPQEGDELTYVHQSGDLLSNSDGGDEYTGLDRFGRVIDQWWYDPSTSATIDRLQYGYDADGNVLYKNDLVTSGNSELFGYDNLNRLTSYEAGALSSDHTSIVGTPSDTWSATLDGVGDRNGVTADGTQTNSTFNSQNEQTGYGSATLACDNAGNMTTDQNGNSGYTYDAWGRLVYSTANDFTYDALGRRITAGTAEQLFYSTSGQVLEDRHTHSQYGAIVVDSMDRYVWGPSYVNQVVLQDHYDESTQATTRTYAMQDANYDVAVITNSTGTVLDRFAYDQDGNLRSGNPSSNGWVILWQGMRQVMIGSGSTATTLYESESRFDNPQLGTWISPDSDTYVNGMNYYQMEMGNPISNVDPSGLASAAMAGGMPVMVETGTAIEAGGLYGGEVLGPIDAAVLIAGGILIYVGSPAAPPPKIVAVVQPPSGLPVYDLAGPYSLKPSPLWKGGGGGSSGGDFDTTCETDDENPFADGGPFPSFEDATGIMGGKAENMQNIGPAKDPTMNNNGFTEKWIGQDPDTGDWHSAYHNPATDEWAGGKPSSHED